jgi:hypothetical protein
MLDVGQLKEGDMTTRSVEEIEAAFREMGLDERTWGQAPPSSLPQSPSGTPVPYVFIRIETTTTPLGEKSDADLA